MCMGEIDGNDFDYDRIIVKLCRAGIACRFITFVEAYMN